jgi:hypothetical protein
MTMKNIIRLLLGCSLLNSGLAVTLTPFVYYGIDSAGNPLTNAITIEPWPATNAIIGLSTNVVVSSARSFTPNTNGYVSGNLAANNYRLTVAGYARGITFGMVSSTNTQNLAQLATFPVVVYQNFTLAQFTDAGTAAYSNATAFFLASAAGTAAYSNATAFVLLSAIGTAAYSNTTAFVLSNAIGTAAYSNTSAFVLSNAIGTAAYSNTSAFVLSNAIGTAAYSNASAFVLSNAIGTAAYSNTSAFLLSGGLATNNGMVWLATNLAAATAPDAVLPNGSILTGTNGTFYVRSNGTWVAK